MGGGDEYGHGVSDPDVPRRPGGLRAAGRALRRHPGDRPLQRLQLVPGAVASAVLGASAAGFRSDAKPWWGLRGDWRGPPGASAPDVYLVASGKPRHDLLSTSASLRRLAFLRGENL